MSHKIESHSKQFEDQYPGRRTRGNKKVKSKNETSGAGRNGNNHRNNQMKTNLFELLLISKLKIIDF